MELGFVWGFAWIALKFVGKEEEEEEGEGGKERNKESGHDVGFLVNVASEYDSCWRRCKEHGSSAAASGQGSQGFV